MLTGHLQDQKADGESGEGCKRTGGGSQPVGQDDRAVSDGTAREFAEELYGRLQAGASLGEAVKEARRVAASQPDDPTWLAYTVYGDPRATVSQQRP